MVAMESSAAQPPKSNASKRVRASRDGDRFHYTWAASKLLCMLNPADNLQQISVEGIDSSFTDDEPSGSEVIDIVEYYGSSEEELDTLIIRQFKYSTIRSDSNLSLSEVGSIIGKFVTLDADLRKIYHNVEIRLSIITNRPISPQVGEAIKALKNDFNVMRNPSVDKLMKILNINIEDARDLCSRLDIQGCEPRIIDLRKKIVGEANELTNDTDFRISASLIDLIATRASTEVSGPIRRADVLAAFNCRQENLAPAPCKLDTTPYIQRDVYNQLANQILQTSGVMVITAEGGVGKSTFARALPSLLKDRAYVIIYDCFGQGSYRRPDRPRHRHRDGLVQISTEIAGLGLGLPLIPGGNIAPEEYNKAFIRRLNDASEILPEGQELVIVVDAADNAVLAAEEKPEPMSFVYDLLKLDKAIPANIHIVLTCRPERFNLLKAPSGIPRLELPTFTKADTAEVIRQSSDHRSSRDQDIAEIHVRTAGNPRVLSTVLSETSSINEALELISGLTDAKSPLDALMQGRLNRILDTAGALKQPKLERVSQLLTLLRPSVPLDLLAQLADVSVSDIRSFVSDIGRGLILETTSIQFLDEPTETYFREHYSATPLVAQEVVSKLRELSATSAYAATSLPEVLWSAELYDELLELVGTDENLPSTSDIERTQVKNLRVEFGLRAAVKLQRPEAIVRLAMQAGSGRTGKGLQLTLIRDNPDLAGSCMDIRVLKELIASREIPQSWPGSTLGAEAVLLAHSNANVSAASRVRQAKSAIAAWVRSPKETYFQDEKITPIQVAYIVLAILRTDGTAAAARYLSSYCRSPRFALKTSARLTRVLLSRAEDDEVMKLATALTHPALLLGLFGEMQRVGVAPNEDIIRNVWEKLARFHCRFVTSEYIYRDIEDMALRGVSWLCALAVRHSIADEAEVAERIQACLPASLPRGLGDYRFGHDRLGFLLAIALRAELRDEELSLDHYRTRGGEEESPRDDESLERYLQPSLTWLKTWVKFALQQLDVRFVLEMIKHYRISSAENETQLLERRLARQIMALIVSTFQEESIKDRFAQVVREIGHKHPVLGAKDILPALHGDIRFESEIIELANAARCALDNFVGDISGKAKTLVGIARGLYPFSADEAGAYFDYATKIMAGIDDDTTYRWESILALTKVSSGISYESAVSLATRVAGIGEKLGNLEPEIVSEPDLVYALAELSGSHVLRFLGQWRDRRFGDINRQCEGLIRGCNALLADRPDIQAILAPFSTNIILDDIILKFGNKDVKILSIINNIAARLGRKVSLLPDQFSAVIDNDIQDSSYEFTTGQLNKRSENIKIYQEKIRELDLSQVENFERAVELEQEISAYNNNLLFAEVFKRSELKRGPILKAALASRKLGHYRLVQILNKALECPHTSLSYKKCLKDVITTYIEQYSTSLLQGNLMNFDLSAAARLLERSKEDLIKQALNHLNLEEILADSKHCYRLAAEVSAVLTSSEVARVLVDVLTEFEKALNITPEIVADKLPEESIDVAIANFLWSALGDPCLVVRWQAAHAVRAAFELNMSDVCEALRTVAEHGNGDGYTDKKFPFYEMSAIEWLLIAIERVSHDSPDVISSFIPLVSILSVRYPDHVTIQKHCYEIAQFLKSSDNISIGTKWENELLDSEISKNGYQYNRVNSMMEGAPYSEFKFDFDFNDYVLGPLSDKFNITHQEVLSATSNIILTEWGYEFKDGYVEDPRRIAGIYQEEETFGYRECIPKTEDLKYYLQRHAALTVAGRLIRQTTPYRGSDEEEPGVLGWLANFDIARSDGRWITDQRRPVPNSLCTISQGRDGQLRETEFLFALKPSEDWVTIWQSASINEYEQYSDIRIKSALVEPGTINALLRALQTAESYLSFRLPSADPEGEEFQLNHPPFCLQGWVSDLHVESGIDRLDQFAAKLAPALPCPSEDIIKELNISSIDGGTCWQNNISGDVIMKAETWADISAGRGLYGPSGYRLRIKVYALDELLSRLNRALIAEVYMDKNKHQQYRNLSKDEKNGQENGSNFRVFSYMPGAGWSDYRGYTSTW